jgi:squalene synthase HpnC
MPAPGHKPGHAIGENPRVSVDHYENFPVASVLCPPRLRPPIVAIYHFARTADDLADEGEATPAARLADLAEYRQALLAATQAGALAPRWQSVFAPLRRQVQAFGLPVDLLHDLLDAFEQDVRNPHYPDRAALLDYCRRSANPIGRLLLHLYGIHDAQALRRSDAICSALQLINFWQDLSVDGPRGRHYVPVADADAHGVSAADLTACRDSPKARQLVCTLNDWATALMREGAPLCLQLPGRGGWELRLVVAGGLRIAERIRRMDHATLASRPALTAWDLPNLLWRALRIPTSNAPALR